MAMSATISITPSSVTTGPQQVAVNLTVSNSGTQPVSVTSILPTASPSGANPESVSVLHGMPFIGPGSTVAVPGGGSLVFQWTEVLYAPVRLGGSGFLSSPSSFQYSIGAIVQSNDGSVFTPTAATLTVNA